MEVATPVAVTLAVAAEDAKEKGRLETSSPLNGLFYIKMIGKSKKNIKTFGGNLKNNYFCAIKLFRTSKCFTKRITNLKKQIIMKTIKSFALALSVIASAGVVTSCSNDDYKYDEEYAQKVAEAEFKANFEKAIGKIAPNQEWDFSSGSEFYLAGNETRATRAGENYGPTISTDYYQVDNNTLAWLKEKLPESTNNKKLGSPFVMKAPSNKFSIIPIYQGQAGMVWDLHMVVGTGEDAQDIKVWSKSENMQTSSDGKNWKKLSTSEYTNKSAYVRAKEYSFEGIPTGESIYFYLEITTGSNGWATKGTKQSSLSGMMLALDCPRPINIDEKKEVMVIGCEDANLSGSDWDMNDIVFLVVGDPEVPKPDVIEDDKVIEKNEKRYMIEDLGVTDDFDFNDVVVDVKAERTVTYHIVNGELKSTEYGDWSQKATIKHVGGNIPFTLTIGNTVIKDHAPGYADLEEEHEITGWDPEKNNISVSVRSLTNNTIYNIDFPKAGAAPLIIATNTKRAWMGEREKIDWIKEELNENK